MRYRDSFLVGSILLSAACGGRTRFGTSTSNGGMTSLAGARSTGAMTPTGGAGGSTSAGGNQATSTSACGTKIDDMEDGTGHICQGEGRKGVWYAFDDQSGTQWPAPTTPGIPIATSLIPGGRGASLRAMHTYGASLGWAGIGLDLNFDGITYGLYDASAYSGITFWARGDYSIEARVSTAATTSTQWGGTCTLDTPPVGEGCWPHGLSPELNDEWVQYWLPFDQLAILKQSPDPNPPAFDRTKLTNIQFRVSGGFRFDFWIDDISFFVGHPGCCSPRPAGCEGTNVVPDPDLKSLMGSGDLACEDVCTQEVLRAQPRTPPEGIHSLQGVQCLVDLREIYLQSQQVADISPIAHLTRLHTVDLSQNLITSVPPLTNLTKLTSLDLWHNQISHLGSLDGLVRLAALGLSDNRIVEIDVLSGLTGLRSLYLARNLVEDVSPLGSLTQLYTLDLSDNRIRDVAALDGLNRLGYLYLAGNQISSVVSPFHLGNLAYLDLSRNQLRDVSGLGGLTQLPYADLSQNQIADIGPLSGLTNIDALNLSSNQISDFGPLFGLARPYNLNLSSNQISDLGPLSGWKGSARLSQLNLANNRIAALPSLGNLTALSELDLSGNQIVDVGALGNGLSRLSKLGLANNRIAVLPSLGNLTALSELDLSRNQIVDVSPLGSLPKLFTLNLAANQIVDVAPLLGFSGLNQRDVSRVGLLNPTVDLSGNPIDCQAQAANIAALRKKPVDLTIDCP